MNLQFDMFKARIRCALADPTKIRYLVAGAWNTFFGYAVGPMIYYGLQSRMHVVLVGVLSYASSITMAFITYKLFVFKTKGGWLSEYFRAYIVYGGSATIGIGVLWGFVDGFGMPFWIAQAVLVFATTISSYVGHSKFTFRRRLSKRLEVKRDPKQLYREKED